MGEVITCRWARWTGASRAHCGACHHTFNSVTLFDRHREGDSCLPPSSLSFEYVAGVWRHRRHDFSPAIPYAETTVDDSALISGDG